MALGGVIIDMHLSRWLPYQFRVGIVIAILTVSVLLYLLTSAPKGVGQSSWTIRIRNPSPDIRTLRIVNSVYKNVIVEYHRASPNEVVEFPCILRAYVSSNVVQTHLIPDVSTVQVSSIGVDVGQVEQVYGMSIAKSDTRTIEATLYPIEQK